jgi:hypothetical protein
MILIYGYIKPNIGWMCAYAAINSLIITPSVPECLSSQELVHLSRKATNDPVAPTPSVKKLMWVVCQARLLRDRLGWFTCSDRPKARTSSFWVQILNAPTSSILGRKEYSISDELYKSILEYLGTCCVAARVGNLETTGGLHLHIVHFLAEANTLVILRCCYPYPLYLALH